MQKKPSQTEILYRAFNDKMRFGNVQALETQLSSIREQKNAQDFKKICNKVMWRLISSVRKAHENDWYDKEYKMLGVLRRASRWLKIDNKNKRMAACVLHKENIAVGEELTAFFASMNPNEHLEPKEVSNKDEYRNLINYFKTAEDVNGHVFQANVKRLIELYGNEHTDYSFIHFSSLYEMMQRFVPKSKVSIPMNLFDDRLQKPDTINKSMAVMAARAYAAYLNEHLHKDKINGGLLYKFHSFLSAVVRKNSYSQDDVKRLTQELNNETINSWTARKYLSDFEKHLFQVYDQKQNIELNKLNTWMEKNPKKRPLSRLARSLVYADMLQQKLVDDVDIGKENFNNLYLEKKDELAQEMETLYLESGKTLSQSEIFSQVEKRRKKEAIERMEPVNILLNKKYRASHFCGATKHHIHECGLKNVSHYSWYNRERDGLF